MTLLVKLGGSIITDKTGHRDLEETYLEGLSGAISDGYTPDMDLVVANGGGSYAHPVAWKYAGATGEEAAEAVGAIHRAAAELNTEVVGYLRDDGLNAFPVQPSAMAVVEDGELASFATDAIECALANGQVPVVHGDALLDAGEGTYQGVPTEAILYQLAAEIGGERVVLCGDTDGVYTADPTSGGDGKKIQAITPRDWTHVRDYLAGANGTDVTGGMRDKVGRAVTAAEEQGIETQIIGGEDPDNLRAVLEGDRDVGTLVTA